MIQHLILQVGYIETRKNLPSKEGLLKLAKDKADLQFDLELDIIDQLKKKMT